MIVSKAQIHEMFVHTCEHYKIECEYIRVLDDPFSDVYKLSKNGKIIKIPAFDLFSIKDSFDKLAEFVKAKIEPLLHI